MSRRRSVYLDGLGHGGNPIPLASVVGRVVMSGGVVGRDPQTGVLAESNVAQIHQMMTNVESILRALGGTSGDLVKLDVTLVERSDRAALNDVWTRWFPVAADRPARKVEIAELGTQPIAQCQFVAVLPPWWVRRLRALVARTGDNGRAKR